MSSTTLPRPEPGTLSTYRVACFWCDRVLYLFPPAATADRARDLVEARGWELRAQGWHCKRCVSSRSSAQKALRGNVQVTLPGFKHLSRNAR